jgi:hypothetical protein
MIWGVAEFSDIGASMGVVVRLGDPDRHFWLARSVGRVIGVDLGEAVTRGELSHDTYRGIINRCRKCAMVEACQDWLGESGGQAEAPPAGCLIAGELNRLKRTPPPKGAC